MEETELYLKRVAYVEAFGRQIKEDYVRDILVHNTNVTGTWMTRRVENPNTFSMACLFGEVVHQPMIQDRLKGNGFKVQVSQCNQFKGGLPYKLKLKVSSSLFNLSLICWNSQVVAIIVSSFGLPYQTSKSCLCWKDFTLFDFFFCEDIESVAESAEETMGSLTYNVKVRVNFVFEQGSPGTPSLKDDSNIDSEEED